jgi:hypothetical protein
MRWNVAAVMAPLPAERTISNRRVMGPTGRIKHDGRRAEAVDVLRRDVCGEANCDGPGDH